MSGVIFDLPDVISLAAERLKAEGYLERVKLAAGDFYKDELPKGCDLALLSAIIHQNSPQENISLYRKIYQALEPGGAVLIRDHIMDESRTRPTCRRALCHKHARAYHRRRYLHLQGNKRDA